jgi:AsmA protein
VLAVVVAALAAVLTFGPALLNLERYRGQIARQASRAVGREVTLGSITANLWRLGAEARGIQVAERPGYGIGPFLRADALRLRVELLPLLRGQVRVAGATLERPRIRLVRDQTGHWNIEDLWFAGAGATAGPAGSQAPGSPADHRAPRVAAAGGLLLRELRARGGELVVSDLRGGAAGAAPLSVTNLQLDLHQQADPRDGISLTLGGQMAGGTLEATARLASKATNLAVEGRGALKGFELAALGPHLGSQGMSGPADLSLTAKGSWPGPGLDVNGGLELSRARFDLGGPLRKLPGEEGQMYVGGRLAGEGPGGPTLDLPTVHLKWRGVVAEGRAHVTHFQPFEVSFDLETPRLDLGQLLSLPTPKGATGLFGPGTAWAAAREGTGTSSASRPGAKASETPLGPAGPRAPASPARLQGTLRAGVLLWRGLEAKDVRSGLSYRDAVLTVQDLTGVLAGGRFKASGSGDFRGRHPSLKVTYRLEQAQLRPLVAALAPQAKFQAHGLVTTEGTITAPPLAAGGGSALGALAGSGNFLINEGRLIGYEPLDRLATTLQSFSGGRLRMKAGVEQFERLTATYTLDKGFLRTKDLTLVRPDGQATAAGSLNVLDRSLDFDVKAHFGKVSVEAKVQGTTADPIVVPSVARLDRRFEVEIDRALKDRGKGGVRDVLRDLFR